MSAVWNKIILRNKVVVYEKQIITYHGEGSGNRSLNFVKIFDFASCIV